MRLPGNRRGATLVEQLIALLLGFVMITSLYGFYRAELFHILSQEAKIVTLEDARGAMDMMARDLKNAGSWGNGTAPLERGIGDDPDGDADLVCNRIYRATRRLIHIQMDLNGNDSCADTDPRENIRYELAGSTATCPGAVVIRRNGDCLVSNVTTPVPDKLFTYYDINGMDLGDAPAPAVIKRVRIAFSVEANNPDPKGNGKLASMLSNSIELRN